MIDTETIEELKRQVEELKDRFEQETSQILEKIEAVENADTKEDKRKLFDPELGDTYYFVNDRGRTIRTTYSNGIEDSFRIDIGNFFLTEEEAKFEAERLKVITRMKKYSFEQYWSDENQAKFILLFNHVYKYIDIVQNRHCQYGDIFFKSLEDFYKCVDEIGEETIKKYCFRLKD